MSTAIEDMRTAQLMIGECDRVLHVIDDRSDDYIREHRSIWEERKRYWEEIYEQAVMEYSLESVY